MNPIVSLIIANIIWGAASPIFKFSLTNIPPFTLAFIRFFFASLLFIPFIKPKDIKIGWKNFLRIFLGLSFFGVFINVTFFFMGLQRTESINAPVIASSGPVFIFIFSVLFLKEKPKWKVLTGMIIALLGAMVIIFEPIFLGKSNGVKLNQFEGNLFLLGATFGSVLYPLVIKNIVQKINTYLVTFIGFFFGSFLFLPFVFLEWKTWSLSQLNLAGWIGIVFGVFFSSALAYFLYSYGLSKIKTQEVGLFTYIDPIVAVVIAIPLLSEYPNYLFLIGAGLVFMGIFIAEKRIHYHPFKRIKNMSLRALAKQSH